ncbi:MAG: oligosaccharide flippase family protein [Actinomycetota bacterium]|nr:oligosaccharide flippase family protein [Actinomycetota bacterium]
MAALLSALWLVVAARQLPVVQFGDLAVLLSVGAVVVVIADLGLPFLLADAAARAGQVSRRTLRTVVVRRLVAGGVAALATMAFYLMVASDTRPSVPAVFALSILATTVHSSLMAGLRGLSRFGTEAVNDVVSRAGVLLVGWFWLAHGGGLLAAVTVYAAADVTSVLVLGALARRWAVDGDDGIDLARMRLRGMLVFSAGRLLAVLYYRADVWLVALFGGPAAAARYAAPYRVLDGLLLMPRAMGSVSVTHAAVEGAGGSARPLTSRLALGALGSVAVIAIPLMMFPGPAMTTAFGTRYADSAPILAVLMASALPGAVVMALVPVTALRHARRFTATMALALSVNVGLNLLLIPRYGPLAAAWTTLLCQLGLAVVLVRAHRRTARESPADPPERAPAKLAPV